MAKRTTRRKVRRRPRRASAVAAPKPALATALREACETLDDLDVAYALVGGLAVSARAEPRLTRDVDVAVAVDDDAAAESLVRELVGRGYKVRTTVEQSKAGRLATVRVVPPREKRIVVDLLFASCGIEPEIVRAADELEILPSLTVPVATSAHLIAMKLLARDDRERPQDFDDLRNLIPTLSTKGTSQVLAAVKLIEKRGFARGRDLVASWRELHSSRR